MSDTRKNPFFITVAQLINVLKTLPSDLPVLVSGYENGYENFYHPEIVTMRHEPENMYYDGQFQIAEEKDTDTFDAVILQREFRDD